MLNFWKVIFRQNLKIIINIWEHCITSNETSQYFAFPVPQAFQTFLSFVFLDFRKERPILHPGRRPDKKARPDEFQASAKSVLAIDRNHFVHRLSPRETELIDHPLPARSGNGRTLGNSYSQNLNFFIFLF